MTQDLIPREEALKIAEEHARKHEDADTGLGSDEGRGVLVGHVMAGRQIASALRSLPGARERGYVTEVCDECDIADCKHIRARRAAKADHLSTKDALLKEALEALEVFERAPQDAWRWERDAKAPVPARMPDDAHYPSGPITYGDLRLAASVAKKIRDGK